MAIMMLITALISFYFSIDRLVQGDRVGAGYFLIMGLIGMAFSAYVLLQIRRLKRLIALKAQPVLTIISCFTCGFKVVRDFRRGDYIFKEIDDPCPKCSKRMTISAIYREVKEREKAPSRF